MTTVSPDMLKPCDIRGLYPKPLGNLQAEEIGRAVGTLVKEWAQHNIKVVVGLDVRESSEALRKALLHGLRGTGLKICDTDLASTPFLAFVTRLTGAAVGIMITASHNPPQYNGFKFFMKDGPAAFEWIEKLYAILKSGSFRKGAGVVEKRDYLADYRNALVNSIGQNFQGLKIVVDPGNGMAGLTAPSVFSALNCTAEFINESLDGRFPGRGPDSSNPQALEKLGERVRRGKATLGIAFDGDGDRVSFVDEKGRAVSNDLILGLFASELLNKHKNAKVVYDGKCSDWVEKKIQDAGGVPILERSGHSYIYTRMGREKALLGGESSGHFFLPGIFPGDALYASLRLLEMLKENNKTLGQFNDDFPQRFSTHDIKLELTQEMTSKLFTQLKSRAQQMGGKVSMVDGVRAVFGDGWGIVRMSVTEPVLSCRFEASTDKKTFQLIEEWLQDDPAIQKAVLKRLN
jgi:phosphomannomutase/phosphoglucomutase